VVDRGGIWVRKSFYPWWFRLKNIMIGFVLSLLINPVGMNFQLVAAQEPAPQSTVYYVAPTGNDSGPGTISQPWQTIQKAAQTMVVGDTVYIRSGTYREQVVPKNSGSPAGYITYAAYPGETPILDGSGISLRDSLVGLFEISEKSYLRVSGLRVVNVLAYPNNGGIIVKRSSHIILEKNQTYNTISSGIGVWHSLYITIDSNRVEYANISPSQECMTIASTGAFQVSNNEVFDCNDEGINVKEGSTDGKVFRNHVHNVASSGIYIDSYDNYTHDIQVYQNLVHDISDDNGIALSSEKGGLLENVYVYNNIIYNNRYIGILLSSAGSGNSLGQHPVKNVWITNNTIYNNGWTKYGGGIKVDNPFAQQVVIRNNIVSDNLSFQIVVDQLVPPQNVTIDHNLIDGYRGYDGEIYGSAAVVGDPLFTNPSATDFHLQPGSPAIDKGSSSGTPEDDFAGNPRPQGLGFDIGAYEAPFFRKIVTPTAASITETITYTISIIGNGNPISVTDYLPSQLTYLASTLTCPGSVSYEVDIRLVRYAGTPTIGQECNLEIVVRVDTDRRMAVINSATIDNGQLPVKNVSATAIFNGTRLYLPCIYRSS
jgi:uncharacterized repeat protein (TIGR01451 family)